VPQQGFGGLPQQGLGGMPQQGGGIGSPFAGGIGGGGLGGGGAGLQQQPLGGLGGMPPSGMAPGIQQPQETVEPPEDMGCTSGPHAATWAAVKQRFRAVTASPLSPVPRETLVAVLEEVMQALKAAKALSPETKDECGLGKLCLQLLSLVSVDDAQALMQLFSSFEQLASPVLTMLLDVPWAAAAQGGWPLFGLLAQLNLRKINSPGALNTDPIDGLSDPTTRSFYEELNVALGKDGAALEATAQAFLQKDAPGGTALGPLTAMAAQAAGTPELRTRAQMLGTLQGGLKQVIADAGELDIALSTRWPLFGLLHVGVDSLVAA